MVLRGDDFFDKILRWSENVDDFCYDLPGKFRVWILDVHDLMVSSIDMT